MWQGRFHVDLIVYTSLHTCVLYVTEQLTVFMLFMDTTNGRPHGDVYAFFALMDQYESN